MAFGLLPASDNLALAYGWTANTGGAVARLSDEMTGVRWKSGAAASVHNFTCTLPSMGQARLVNYVGLFEVFPTTPVSAVSARIGDVGAWTTGFLSERNSVSIYLPPIITIGPNTINIEVSLSSPGMLEIGEIVAGGMTEFPHHWRSAEVSDIPPTVVNGDFTVEVGASRMVQTLDYPP